MRVLKSNALVPASDFDKPLLFEFDNFEVKVGPEPPRVELDAAGEALHLDQFHVVDEGVAMLPGVAAVAVDGGRLHLLAPVQLCDGSGEQLHCVVDQRRFSLPGGSNHISFRNPNNAPPSKRSISNIRLK